MKGSRSSGACDQNLRGISRAGWMLQYSVMPQNPSCAFGIHARRGRNPGDAGKPDGMKTARSGPAGFLTFLRAYRTYRYGFRRTSAAMRTQEIAALYAVPSFFAMPENST